MREIILKIVITGISVFIIAFIIARLHFIPTGFVILPSGVDLVVERNLSGFNSIGEEFSVVLDVTIRDNSTAVTIEEYVPSGSNITWCSESNYKIVDNKIEVLLFDQSSGVTTVNVLYNITLISGGIFNGSWRSISPDLNGTITGDIIINISSYCSDGLCNNGEDCSSCSGDCGSCSSSNFLGGSSGSDGSGGGGGGGSSSSSSSGGVTGTGEVIIEMPESELEEQSEPKEEEIIKGEENVDVKEQGFFKIAGNFIVGEEGERLTLIGAIVIALIIGTGLILYRHKIFNHKKY